MPVCLPKTAALIGDWPFCERLCFRRPRAGGLASRSTLAAAMDDAEAASSMGLGLQPAAAAAVAARGVLFANSQLASSTWQPLRMSQSVAAHNATVACRVSARQSS